MRVGFRVGTVLTCASLVLAMSACGGGRGAASAPAGVPANRAGYVSITRTHIVGAYPEESVLADAAFFAPPGPLPSVTPVLGTCSFVTPTPTPSAAPTPTPAVGWRDAGDSVTLVSGNAQLQLDRFAATDGSIVYVSDATADATLVPPGATFDLTFPGGSGANAMPPSSVTGAATMPAALALYAPDFSGGGLELSRAPLQIGWDGGDPAATVFLTLTIAGTTGNATLLCATADDGFFELTANQIGAFPSGTGTLALLRTRDVTADLTSSTVIVGQGRWIEGGVVVLP